MTIPGTPTSGGADSLVSAFNDIANRKIDPGVAGAGPDSWWNNNGVVCISVGGVGSARIGSSLKVG